MRVRPRGRTGFDAKLASGQDAGDAANLPSSSPGDLVQSATINVGEFRSSSRDYRCRVSCSKVPGAREGRMSEARGEGGLRAVQPDCSKGESSPTVESDGVWGVVVDGFPCPPTSGQGATWRIQVDSATISASFSWGIL